MSKRRASVSLHCFAVGGLAAALALADGGTACAQAFPGKPLRIVTSEVGGGNDVQARLVAQGLTAALGQQVVVENRPSGVVPGEIVSKAPADGYTLLFYNNTFWLASLIQKTPYDALRDFAPVTVVTKVPNVLVVNPALPVKSVADLVALAAAKPGALNYGSAGTGASNHLAAELFKNMAHVEIVRINYKGAGPALTALLTGELQLMFPTAGAAVPHVKAGRVKALAVTSAEPTRLFAGLPTMAASLPGYESMSIYGIFAPAGTPRSVINRLNTEIVRFLRLPAVRERFFNAGMETSSGTPEQLFAAVKSDLLRTGKIIKDTGIRGE